MPYINPEQRYIHECLKKAIDLHRIDNPGDLNYLVTALIHSYLEQHTESYQFYNDVVGVLEGAKLEVYRRYVANYEDRKITENGDV